MCQYPFTSDFKTHFDINYRAPDDLHNPDKIRSLLKDLREARQAKSRDGLGQIDHSDLSVRIFF